MKPRAVKRYRQPVYPTRLEVLSDPTLLERHLPPGWRAAPMAGTVALFLAVNASVHAADKKPAKASGPVAVVAPIFDHGTGRGAIGCVVVAPPVFLSEEEAWAIIDEELARQNVKLSATGFSIKGVQIPHRSEEHIGTKLNTRDDPGTAKPYQADRADPGKCVALEFVSEKDYHRLGGARSMSTVQVYNFKEVAQSLDDTVAKQSTEKLRFAALYDPAMRIEMPKGDERPKTQEDWRKFWADTQRKSKAESERLLRLQVQDFLSWLQAQGAI
jgi:hypothetical protein